jgi:hypothetical protein
MNKNGKNRNTSGKNNRPGHESKAKPEVNGRSAPRKNAHGPSPKRNEEDIRAAKHPKGQSDTHASGAFQKDEEERDERLD